MLLISLSILLDNRILRNKRRKEIGKNTEETNGCTRPERANKVVQLHNSWKKKKKKKTTTTTKKKREDDDDNDNDDDDDDDIFGVIKLYSKNVCLSHN